MRALDHKLWRDLWNLKGQATAISLVIACGIAIYIMFLSTLDSLEQSRASFYDNYRFGQVFASLKRAPDSLRSRILEIPGVINIDTRVAASVNLDIKGFDEPVTGKLVSIPDKGDAELNKLYLRKGRLP